MNLGKWYVEECQSTSTWDISFGTPGKGFGTIECHSESDATRVAELLNTTNALPTDIAVVAFKGARIINK